jgi:hypothetical protein
LLVSAERDVEERGCQETRMLAFDQYDPDEWIAAGKNLTDYPYPPDQSAEAQPEVRAHLARWFTLCLEFNGTRGGKGLADKLTEEEARVIWEETRKL